MGAEKRLSLRKTMRTDAVLSIEGAPPVAVQTMDIARYGIGLVAIPAQMEKGQEGTLAFNLPVNGKHRNIHVRVHVAYCLPAGDVFRAGLEFLNMDPATAMLIAYYVDVGD